MLRLFISLNLTENIKQEIEKNILSPKRNIRFIPAQNWHLTILFLGNQKEEDLDIINRALQTTAFHFASPSIVFDKIEYAPKNNPRMLWLMGTQQSSDYLDLIKKFLEEKLCSYINFKRESRKYITHLTLARFTQHPTALQDRGFTLCNKISFCAKSLYLMQSFLHRQGAIYKELSKFDFREK